MATGEDRPRLAVVLFNLGGPDSLKAVRPFLFNLFRDPAIVSLPTLARLPVAAVIALLRTREASLNYAHMGGASPLAPETQAQSEALGTWLSEHADGFQARVFVAMRYWRPTIRAATSEVAAFAPDEIILLPLYPQFSTTTTGSSLTAWREAYRGPGRVRTACCYFDETGLVEAHARKIEATYAQAGRPANVRLLFSAHGLPERVIAGGDPYQHQIERTCRAVAERLGPGWDWQVCYQSRVGPLKWIGPSTPQAVQAAGAEGKGVLVTPIAFTSEHVETLVELDRDYAVVARAAGCPVYLRVPAVGSDPAFIAGLGRTVLSLVETTSTSSSGVRPGGGACELGWRGCPYRNAALAA